MTTPPTPFRELAKATKNCRSMMESVEAIHDFHARLSPETMLKVYEALDDALLAFRRKDHMRLVLAEPKLQTALDLLDEKAKG